MRYSDDEKALIMLSHESSVQKRTSCLASVKRPRDLYGNYAHADTVIEYMSRRGMTAVTYCSEGYPEALRDLYDPPAVLYCRGNTALLSDMSRNIAVVGTRRITRYGKDVTACFVRAFAESGLCVVSGMARGVDTLAHRTALDCGADTVAVLGCGADVPYPPENAGLLKEIAAKGLVVSESPTGTQPDGHRFPERHRIISEPHSGVLVTEAAAKTVCRITTDGVLATGTTLCLTQDGV